MIGYIYRIIHLESDIQYIGSTLNEPRKRWQDHKRNYNSWMNGHHSEVCIYPYFREYGLDKFKLIAIKSYEVVDRRHLEAMEQLWISKLKCINAKASFNPIYQTKHLRHKLRNNQKYKCECGSVCAAEHKRRHMRTAKHQRWLSSQ